MEWQNIAVGVTLAAVVVAAVRLIVLRIRGRRGGNCCGCSERDCPRRR